MLAIVITLFAVPASSSGATTPRSIVEAMPRRTAHALYGALTASIEAKMPVTAREAQIYDEEAITARQTAAGLRHAQHLGWVAFDGTYWWTDTAQEIKYALEERYLRETDRAEQPPSAERTE